MRRRNSQVDHDLDLWVGEQLVNGVGFDVVFRRLRLRPRYVQVGAGNQFQVVKGLVRFEIDAANVTAADNAEFCALGSHVRSYYFVAVCINGCTSQ